jgi:hypothetical protein
MFLVLESMERALARGATIHGEVAGYGRNSDAYHITAPSPGGAGAARCMQLALDDAGLNPSDIGHINAHGTSTPLNDAAEAEAIRKVFGDVAPPVTAPKGVLGHMIGGAGAAEAVISLMALRDQVLPPTANLTQIGDDIGLDVVRQRARISSQPAISNSFVGGHTALVARTGRPRGHPRGSPPTAIARLAEAPDGVVSVPHRRRRHVSAIDRPREVIERDLSRDRLRHPRSATSRRRAPTWPKASRRYAQPGSQSACRRSGVADAVAVVGPVSGPALLMGWPMSR